MTLREALQAVDAQEVFKYIHDVKDGDVASLEKVANAYLRVIEELLSKPPTKDYGFPICVRNEQNYGEDITYVSVVHLNPGFVEPPEGLKPWGGDSGPVPDGYYDCNDTQYSKYLAFGFTPWSGIIDTQIINETELPLTAVVAEILWELTFYGWSEKQQQENVSKMLESVDEAVKNLK